MKKLVDERKRHGRSAGAGFYEYADGKHQRIWPGLKEPVTAKPAKTGLDLIAARLLLVQSAEAARTLEDGVLQRNRDAEVGAIFGIGFEPNTGGLLSYIDRCGVANVVRDLEAFAREHGDRYAPPKILVQMAEKNERFFEAV